MGREGTSSRTQSAGSMGRVAQAMVGVKAARPPGREFRRRARGECASRSNGSQSSAPGGLQEGEVTGTKKGKGPGQTPRSCQAEGGCDGSESSGWWDAAAWGQE